MSWLARSLTNSLRLGPGDDDPHNDVVPSSSFISAHPSPPSQPPPFSSSANHDHHHHYDRDTPSEEAQSRGVKEDLSELSQTLTRQFWGVASFLAPPHTPSHSPLFDPPDRSDHFGSAGRKETSGSPGGIRSDFAVSEISSMASDLITVDAEEEEDKIEGLVEYTDDDGEYENGQVEVGITHEVLTFARNIAMHPETWLDFPIDEEEDTDDFDMSVAQREHAFAIEQFSPRLAALRNELCPYHMSLGYFWKVYFVLLHSRLNKYDAEILSTPQVMAARAKWMQELHKQTKPDPDYSARSISHFRDDFNSLEDDCICTSESMPLWSFSTEPTASSHGTTDHEIEKHPVVSTEMPIIDKSVIEEECVSKTNNTYSPVGPSKIPIPDFEDEDNDWLEEEDLELQGYKTGITMGNEEDVSFSDLEDDDDYSLPKKLGTVSKGYGVSVKKS